VNGLIVPEALEAPWAQLHVSRSMPNVTMAQIGLDQAQIRAALSQVIPAGMPEHVRMAMQGTQPRPLRRTIDHQPDSSRSKRPATLRGENEIRRLRSFPLQAPQRSNFYPTQAMITIAALFRPPDMENPLLEVELWPAGIQALAYAQSVSKQNHDKRCITVTPSPLTRRFDEFFYLTEKQMLAFPRPPLRDCSPNGDWHHVSHMRNPQVLHRVALLDCSEKAQKGNS
jgi:hypothetical protein